MRDWQKFFRFAAVGLAASVAQPAIAGAKVTYSAYEGKPVIKTGEGGTKVSKNGIDYWTSGEPPRRFQVVGMIEDKRDEMLDGGHAIGSPNIAGKVKKAGADAVIVQSQEEAGKGGGMGTVNSGFGFLFAGGSKTITRMVVIKYLPDEPSNPVAIPPAAP